MMEVHSREMSGLVNYTSIRLSSCDPWYLRLQLQYLQLGSASLEFETLKQ